MKTVLKQAVRNSCGYTVNANHLILLERDTGLEPATFALARRRSTN